MRKEKHVIIIGAGAAGLLAAEELLRDCRVTIIEAAAGPGGRIRSMPLDKGEGVIEAGAEFVHGELPITDRLIRQGNLTRVKVEGKMFRKEDGQWHKQEDMIEGWDELLARLSKAPESMTMSEFLELYYPGNQYSDLREHVRSYVQGFDVADVEKVSARSLYEEWSAEEEQYRLKEGYGALVDQLYHRLLANGCEFIFSDPVIIVHWKKGSVQVTCASGKKFTADRVLVTVPIPVLRNPVLLAFQPAIPEQLQAAGQIGFGSVVKVIFDFREPFWKDGLGFVFSREAIPTWWTQYPLDNNLLTGWAGGPDAARIFHLPDKDLESLALNSIAAIFDKRADELRTNLKASYVFNWIKEKNCSGAYSFATPATKAARKNLLHPVEGTLFFAGEGLFDGAYPGTVEAAFHSGSSAAARILASF